ncbi:MAG: ATP-binding protein [Lacunisphaera sp.]
MSSHPIGRRLNQWLSGKSVRYKLGFITTIAVSCAALTASASLLVYHIFEQRANYEAETLALTQIVAENATGSVSFQDIASAESVLATLRATPSIRGAVIDIPNRQNFAVYGNPPALNERLHANRSAAYNGWWLHTAATIGEERSPIGTVNFVSDLRPMLWAATRASIAALILALSVSLLLGLFVLRQLRGVILDPVENLHTVTRRVTENADFSQRAEVISHDEMGELTIAFNRMLDRLEAKDAEVRSANLKLIGEMDERKRLEAKLLETSRHAGMAQVATGVLHNVGNVLNSVNISANILRDTITANPKLKLLKQTVELMRAQGDGLPHFLSEDVRGRLVPSLLMEVIEQLLLSRTETVRELDEMTQNVEHIKQIVAMQQSYAKAGGVVQNLKPSELMDEAMRMTQASSERHGVRFKTKFADVPLMETDRHQVLQILVNFITNAVQAVKVRPDGERLITLTLREETDRVFFAVEDNGSGISVENLQKIFQHGFTTRKDGHGFGLHSGAIAARNLGGKVEVHSDGPGCGARFTLDLPSHAQIMETSPAA